MNDGTFSIKDKKILFLAPAFFGYELKIKTKMEEMGAIVDFYDERSVANARDRALLKISPYIFLNRTKKYYNDILKNNKDKNYDYIFVINCRMITHDILEDMKAIHQNAKFCLYLWDSVNNISGIESKLRYFDRVLSFDSSDSKGHNNIFFRPLFYLDDYRVEYDSSSSSVFEIDLGFLGTIHSDRFAVLKKIKKVCEDTNLTFFSFQYLQSKFMFYFFKLTKREFKGTKINDFSYEKMNSKDISDIVRKSKVILDIEHPKQTGLTMRTIEMIGMQKKIITTNKDIVNYDFYDSQNILVISRDNPEFPHEFFDSEYKLLDKNIYDKYNMESWIRDVLFG